MTRKSMNSSAISFFILQSYMNSYNCRRRNTFAAKLRFEENKRSELGSYNFIAIILNYLQGLGDIGAMILIKLVQKVDSFNKGFLIPTSTRGFNTFVHVATSCPEVMTRKMSLFTPTNR